MIDARAEYLVRFLEGSNRRFTIPIYQRNYDWRVEHCATLYNDIKNMMSRRNEYFIGSIVFSLNGSREYLIIDGQQRITTVSLLLLAMANYLEKNQPGHDLVKQIRDTYLIDKYAEENKRIRLKPIKQDSEAFLQLFSNRPSSFVASSNVTINYNFFYKELEKSGIEFVPKLFEAIEKLRIITIELSSAAQPQEIFESLNSTGKQLEDADLVRNFILMRQSAREQERLYETYWHQIELNTNYEVSDFIRHYLTYARNLIPNKDKVYKTFKEFVSDKKWLDRLEDLLADLLRFSSFYGQIKKTTTKSQQANVTLRYINRLKVTVAYPFLFDVFDLWEKGTIPQNDFESILCIIESYTFRRYVCEVSTNSLNKIFATMGKDMRRHSTEFNESFLETFKFVLLSNNAVTSKRFPLDSEFCSKFKDRVVYENKVYGPYILERLENFDNRERIDLEALMQSGEVSIEHIMPQSLTKEWKAELGENASDTYNRYLHTIGNLTLTGYNQKLSNRPFGEKKTMENGFLASRLYLNKFVAEQPTWNAETMEERASKLTERALMIWPEIATSYQVKSTPSEVIYLSEDFSFTGLKPSSYIISGEDKPVTSWRELLISVLEHLHSLDPSCLYRLCEREEISKVSSIESSLRNPHKIDEALYIAAHGSAYTIIAFIRQVLPEFGIDESDVGISLAERSRTADASALDLEEEEE